MKNIHLFNTSNPSQLLGVFLEQANVNVTTLRSLTSPLGSPDLILVFQTLFETATLDVIAQLRKLYPVEQFYLILEEKCNPKYFESIYASNIDLIITLPDDLHLLSRQITRLTPLVPKSVPISSPSKQPFSPIYREEPQPLDSFLDSLELTTSYITSLYYKYSLSKLSLFTRQGDIFKSTFQLGIDPSFTALTLSIFHGIGRALTQANHIVTNHTDDPQIKYELRMLGLSACIPIQSNSQTIGILCIGNTILGEELPDETLLKLFYKMPTLTKCIGYETYQTSLLLKSSSLEALTLAQKLCYIVIDPNYVIVDPNFNYLKATFNTLSNSALDLPNLIVSKLHSTFALKSTLDFRFTTDRSTLDLTFTPMRIKGGYWCLLSIRDITETLVSEAETKLNLRLSVFREVFGQLSHIFNNNLTQLSMLSQLVAEPIDAPLQAHLQKEIPALHAKLSRHFSQLSFFDPQIMHNPKELITLEALLTPLIDKVIQQYPSFKISLPPNPLSLLIEVELTSQLILELLFNAAQQNNQVAIEILSTTQLIIRHSSTPIPESLWEAAKRQPLPNSLYGFGLGFYIIHKIASVTKTKLTLQDSGKIVVIGFPTA